MVEVTERGLVCIPWNRIITDARVLYYAQSNAITYAVNEITAAQVGIAASAMLQMSFYQTLIVNN